MVCMYWLNKLELPELPEFEPQYWDWYDEAACWNRLNSDSDIWEFLLEPPPPPPMPINEAAAFHDEKLDSLDEVFPEFKRHGGTH
jgi:hypothetical protein